MIYYKTPEQIGYMRQSAVLLSNVHAEIAKHIKIGVSLNSLNSVAEDFIQKHDAKPSFLGYSTGEAEYPASICTSVNEVVVHGIPNDYKIKDGDIVSVDCGVLLNGFHADCAYTYGIGNIGAEKEKLLKVTKECLFKGIAAFKKGNRLGDVGFSIESHVRSFGFGVAKQLTGHGIGKDLHEDPIVLNYGKRGKGKKIGEGLTIALEPMITMGSREVKDSESDDWAVCTQDGQPSAHYEHTLAIVNGKTEILTSFEPIERVLNN